jgi:hypothetical protein
MLLIYDLDEVNNQFTHMGMLLKTSLQVLSMVENYSCEIFSGGPYLFLSTPQLSSLSFVTDFKITQSVKRGTTGILL